MNTGEECWSEDGESYTYDTVQELLQNHSNMQVGEVVHVGEAVHPDPTRWVDADDIIEQLSCRASDECGEHAEDYPEVPKEAKDELQAFLEAWVEKHCPPHFWTVKNCREHVLTTAAIVGVA